MGQHEERTLPAHDIGAAPGQKVPAARQPEGHTVAHHDLGSVRWQAGPPPGYGVPGYGPMPYTPPLPATGRRAPRWLLPLALCTVIVLAGVALAGITQSALTAARTTTTVAAGTGDRAYLTALGQRPIFAQIPDDTLIRIGHGICQSLLDGATHRDMVTVAMSSGFGPGDARLLVDAATSSYCPGT